MFLNTEIQAKQSCFVFIASINEPDPPASQWPTKTHLAFKTRLIFSRKLFPVQCALLLVMSNSSCISARKSAKLQAKNLPFWSCLSSLLCCYPTQADLHPSWVCPWVPAPVLFWKSSPELGEGKVAFGCYLWPWHVPADIP